MKRNTLLSLFVAIAAFISGCGMPPQQEIVERTTIIYKQNQQQTQQQSDEVSYFYFHKVTEGKDAWSNIINFGREKKSQTKVVLLPTIDITAQPKKLRVTFSAQMVDFSKPFNGGKNGSDFILMFVGDTTTLKNYAEKKAHWPKQGYWRCDLHYPSEGDQFEKTCNIDSKMIDFLCKDTPQKCQLGVLVKLGHYYHAGPTPPNFYKNYEFRGGILPKYIAEN